MEDKLSKRELEEQEDNVFREEEQFSQLEQMDEDHFFRENKRLDEMLDHTNDVEIRNMILAQKDKMLQDKKESLVMAETIHENYRSILNDIQREREVLIEIEGEEESNDEG